MAKPQGHVAIYRTLASDYSANPSLRNLDLPRQGRHGNAELSQFVSEDLSGMYSWSIVHGMILVVINYLYVLRA